LQSKSKFAVVRSAVSRPLRRLSLRARLAVGLVLVVAVGLVVADVIVFDEIQSYLYGQVDQELVTALTPVKAQLSGGGGPFATFSFGRATPPGTYGAAIDTSGVVKETPTGDLIGPPPVLPQSLLSSPRTARAVHFTTSASSGSSLRYRVLAQPVILNFIGSPPRLGYAVVAIPLRSLDDTLGRLVTIDIIVSAVVLAALAAVGYVVVRVGMRPLAEIERTAGAIAAGDLSQRVERQDDRTEVGRLGASLNEMLGKIEHAFSEQRASEDRLRQFLADASHELRTPITSIRGYSELFRRGAASRPQDLASSMRRIEDEATRMGVLVDDLLLLARLDQGRPLEKAPVDLAEIATDVVADASVVAPNRPVTIDAVPPVVVIGDEMRLRQMVENLVRNAFEHTPALTPIFIRVDAEGDLAVLTVSDQGPGVSEEHRGRIFERFYRADPSRTRASGGAGLGLSIVASIAEAHGGSARLDPDNGKGATFIVEIPLAPPLSATTDDDHMDDQSVLRSI